MQSRPAGYEALIQRHALRVPRLVHASWVGTGTAKSKIEVDRHVEEVFPERHWPGDHDAAQLEFALKYDGTNLLVLARVFEHLPKAELEAYVRSKPTGKYARRLWFLFEFLTGQRLDLKDVTAGNYVDLLEPDEYIVQATPRKVRRQRINDNLLGPRAFCPMVRRTEAIQRMSTLDFHSRSRDLLGRYPEDLVRRALGYLYTKETRSSFDIEHVTPSPARTERFIAQLKLAERDDFLSKAKLVDLQGRIVDPRFRNDDYRTSQNYVGSSVGYRQVMHFVCPQPGDVPPLMDGLIKAHQWLEADGLHPVVHAALVAYGFVFVHPFDDGNGRIHRFLIHNVLARRGLTPEGMIFPVSAVMLKDPAAYDASLEAFSKPLGALIDYDLAENGALTVKGDTADLYRLPDMTAQVEALFTFVERTIDAELLEELDFLQRYDAAKSAMQAIVDMPDRDLDLFFQCCLQNGGKLSKAKRKSHFDALTDHEVATLEQAFAEAGRS